MVNLILFDVWVILLRSLVWVNTALCWKPLQQVAPAFVIPRTRYPAVQISTQSAGFYSNALTESPDSRALSTCVVHNQFESIAPSARSCRCNIPLSLVKSKRDCESSKSDYRENQPRQRLQCTSAVQACFSTADN
ncbi:hypothetical protein AB4K20DRAFT_1846338 [Rhizopus microsporus]|uniref:Secreted protein n=1 Tax=Rhizopus microsporus TaxID=58291 RepID=A0A1X0RLW7_RHIZD|nr:hypothetical protein BCV71DRAFT_239713 [Rhizopus microsporus]